MRWGEAGNLHGEDRPRLVAGDDGIEEGGSGENALGLISPGDVSPRDESADGEETVRCERPGESEGEPLSV